MKKFLTFILVLAMVLSVSSVAMAAGVTTEINLISAVNAGGDVTLGADITLTNTLTIPADVSVTLDLNGKTLSQTKAQTEGYQMILNDGNLTIKDSVGTGKISYTDSGNGGEYISDTIYNRSILVINGGTIENLSSDTVASNGYPHAVDTYSGIRDTSVTINGGTIYCKEYSAIRMFCVSATYKADLIINDGATIKGAVDMQNGTMNRALGSLTVNGGTFETTKNANNIRFANWNGGATEYGITASVKDGSFDGGITTAYVPAAANWDSKIVSGGSFGDDGVKQYVKDGSYTATISDDSGSTLGFVVAKDEVGLKEALNDAVEELIKDGKNAEEIIAEVSVPAGASGPVNFETGDLPGGVELKGGVQVNGATPPPSGGIPMPTPAPQVTNKPTSSGSGISVTYNGGNSFSTSNPAVPTAVEIDGVPVAFNGNGKSFTVSCINPGAKWVTVRWNSTTVTTNFTPDAQSYCAKTVIPKTGDVSVAAYALMAVVAAAGAMLKK